MPIHRNQPRVLLVDDDASVRHLLRRYLRNAGIEVVEAENPFDALGSMSHGPFDLAITDVNMPERSGVWLLEELRSRAPELPVIVMTAGEIQTAGLRALCGSDAVIIRKPFDLSEFQRVLDEVVPSLSAQQDIDAEFSPPESTAVNGRPYCYASTLISEMLARTVGLEHGGLPWAGRVHPDDLARVRQEAQDALQAGRRFRAEYRMLTVDQDVIWVLHESPVVGDSSGQAILGPGAVVDITTRKREELTLRASEERHRFLTEHSTDMITAQSPEGPYLYVSPACLALLGYRADELTGVSAYDLVHRDDLPKVRECHLDVLRRPYMATVDYRVRRKDRRYVWFESTSRVVSRTDPSIPKEIISVSRDITERKQNEERLRELAILDELTGLYNRRGFLALASQQLKSARRSKRNALVLFADLNNLKHINDMLGHKDGDQALVDAAHILNRTFRESDVIARVGGDEFAILAIETDAHSVESIRARLDSALRIANNDRGRPFELSISIGAAAYDHARNDSVEELLAWADRSMYEQKRLRAVAAGPVH